MHLRRIVGGFVISTRSAKISIVLGLLLVVVVAAVWILVRVFGVQNSIATSSELSSVEAEEGTHKVSQHFSEETKKTVVEATVATFELGPIEDFWELCVPEEFPDDPDAAFSFSLGLELSEECQEGFETYMFTRNPFLWRTGRSTTKFSFLVLDESMNFERVLGDPAGDLERIIEALGRPECRLEEGVGVNWELKEACHADAFLNYAEFRHFCSGDRAGIFWHSWPGRKSLTDGQWHKLVWQTLQEVNWLDDKCDAFGEFGKLDLAFELDRETYPEEFAWLAAFTEQRSKAKFTLDTLQELAARLGDEAAALLDTGQFFGSFVSLFASDPWKQIDSKEPLSKERLQGVMDLVIRLEQEEINFNWEWLVEHLCSTDEEDTDSQEPSCRTVINELYFEDMVSGPTLEAVSKFEQVAIELDVYE